MKIDMKNIAIVTILLLATACSSPVEDFIKNDFTRTVRENALEKEIETEVERIVTQMELMALEANKEAKEGEELMAKAQKMKKEIESRLDSYSRTGNYRYIINIAYDEEECNALYAKAQRLKKKAKPYTDHALRQIEAFAYSLANVDSKAIMNSANLVKDDSVTLEYIFNKVVGVPSAFVNPEAEELESIAVAVLTNYFIDNPTPVVIFSEYQKKNGYWSIKLSNEKHYLLRATKCNDGEYDYEYKEVEDSFVKNSGENDKNESSDCDEFLDEYEKFVDGYVKQYKKLYKKSMSGDISVLDDLEELAEEAAEFEEVFEDFDGEMSEKQMERYLKITKKMSDAMMDM